MNIDDFDIEAIKRDYAPIISKVVTAVRLYRKIIGKVILSLLLGIISYCCFCYWQPPVLTRSTICTTKTETSGDGKITAVKTTSNEKVDSTSLTTDGKAKFWGMIGIGCLVLAVWICRKELGIKGVAGVTGDDDLTQKPSGFPSDLRDRGPDSFFNSILTSLDKYVADKGQLHQAAALLGLLRKINSATPIIVARNLKISISDADSLLFTLTSRGLLRADGFPTATVFTLAFSVENLTLDAVRDGVISSHVLLSERRFVVVRQRYDIDAVLTCEDRTFIVEAKHLVTINNARRLDNWILNLLNVAKDFPGKPTACILAITCHSKVFADSIKKEVASLTYDSGKIPVQVLVFEEDELRKKWVG